MIYGFLCPLKKNRLAPFFPSDMLGVAHSAYEWDKEEKITLFSPRELTESEQAELEEPIYDLLHDVEYRIRTRKYLSRIRFNPATMRILGGIRYILQVFGVGGLLLCLWTRQYRPDDIMQFVYWVLAMPLCIALGSGLVLWHAWETILGLRRIYHSPIGLRVVVLPQLRQLADIVQSEGYHAALAGVRDLGLGELILFYRRCAQMDRWTYGDSPNIAGVIECQE